MAENKEPLGVKDSLGNTKRNAFYFALIKKTYKYMPGFFFNKEKGWKKKKDKPQTYRDSCFQAAGGLGWFAGSAPAQRSGSCLQRNKSQWRPWQAVTQPELYDMSPRGPVPQARGVSGEQRESSPPGWLEAGT